MATPEVLEKVDLLGPKPEKTYLESHVEEVKEPAALPFDPAALKERYTEEREKRLKMGGGLAQYRFADGRKDGYILRHY